MPLRLCTVPGSPYWYLRGTVRGQSIRESTKTTCKKAAEALRIAREQELLELSVYGEKAVMTFAHAVLSYLNNGGSRRFLGHYDEKTGTWSGLVGALGGLKLAEIRQADLDALAEKLYSGCTVETKIRQLYTPFSAVWNHAVSQDWAEPRRWRRPRARVGTALRAAPARAGTVATTYDRAARFLASMPPHAGRVMLFLFYTGMRPIEAFNLQRSDVNTDGRWIIVRSSKTGQPRGVPMHHILLPLLDLLPDAGPLFISRADRPWHVNNNGGGQLKAAIEGARARCGITDISPYTCRHTVSTQLVIEGVHPHIKDQILGHAVTDMSRRYTHVPQQPLLDAINLLPVPAQVYDIHWFASAVDA